MNYKGLTSSDYGDIYRTTKDNETTEKQLLLFTKALQIVTIAEKQNLIPIAFDGMGWHKKGYKEGFRLEHEIYDFSKNAVIVCCRTVEGTKRGQSTKKKEYFLLEKSGRSNISCTVLPVHIVAKKCKSVEKYGDAIKFFREVTK